MERARPLVATLCPSTGCTREPWGSWKDPALQASLLWAVRHDISCQDSEDWPEMEKDDLPLRMSVMCIWKCRGSRWRRSAGGSDWGSICSVRAAPCPSPRNGFLVSIELCQLPSYQYRWTSPAEGLVVVGHPPTAMFMCGSKGLGTLLLHQKKKASLCNCDFLLFQALKLNLFQYLIYIPPGCLTFSIPTILTSVLPEKWRG